MSRVLMAGRVASGRAQRGARAQGHFSPVVRQARWGSKPDGVCCVVGACNRGHPEGSNTSGDLIYTDQPLRPSGDAGAQVPPPAPAGRAHSGMGTSLFFCFEGLNAGAQRHDRIGKKIHVLEGWSRRSVDDVGMLQCGMASDVLNM